MANELLNITIPLRGRTTKRTIFHIERIIKENYYQVSDLAQKLKGASRKKTFENIWHWVRNNIRYQNDTDNIEELRRPLRTIHDGFGDCDDKSILISSLLLNLGIEPTLNITDYTNDNKTNYQHIYTSALDENGQRIAIDTVPEIPYFGFEANPIYEHKTIKMQIEELAGIPEDVAADTLHEMSDPSELLSAVPNDVSDEDMEEFLLGNVEIVDEDEGYDHVISGAADKAVFYDNIAKKQLLFARKGIEQEISNPEGLSTVVDMATEKGIIDEIIENFENIDTRNQLMAEAAQKSIYKNFYLTLQQAMSETENSLNGVDGDEPIYLAIDREDVELSGGIEEDIDLLFTDGDTTEGIGAFWHKKKKRLALRAKRKTRRKTRRTKRSDRRKQGKGFFQKVWKGVKKFNPLSVGGRNGYLSMVSLNTGGLGVKLARAFKNNDPGLPALIAKWKKFGGSEKSLRKAAFRSKKARQLKGLAGDPITLTIGAPAVAAIAVAMLPLVKALTGKGASDPKTGGDISYAGEKGAKAHNYESGKTPGKPSSPDDAPSGSDKDEPEAGAKEKVLGFVKKYKMWLIISVIGIILIIAATLYYQSAKKKEKRSQSALKGARTRKRNQKALKGYVGTEKKAGSRTTKVVYSTKKPATKTQKAGGGTQTKLQLSGRKKGNSGRMKEITTLAKKIRAGKPRMKWTNAVKAASKQLYK